MLTIIIPTYNRAREVIEMINSIKLSDCRDYRIVVVDDASTDDTVGAIKNQFPEAEVLVNEVNSGAAFARNRGIKKFINQTDYFLFLDSDETAAPECIGLLLAALESDKKIGAVTPSVYYAEKPEIKQYGEAWVGLLSGLNYSVDKNKSAVLREVRMCGGNFLVRAEAVRRVGLFDEVFQTFYEDADYSLRIRKAGYKLLYAPAAKVFHQTPFLDKKSGDKKWLAHAYLTARNKIIFMKKHSPCFVCFLLFYPVYILFYFFQAGRYRDSKAAKEFCRGIRDGFRQKI